MQEKNAESIPQLHHLNTILRAIRNVNQLIVTEKDPGRLIRKTCRLLKGTEGFVNAWIVLFDETNQYRDAAQSGIGKDFTLLTKVFKTGGTVPCVHKAIAKHSVTSINEPSIVCTDCPLQEKYAGESALTTGLYYKKKTYGVLTVSVKKEFFSDRDARELLNEIAGDIAFALYTIEIEAAHEQARKAIKISEARFRTTLYSIGDAVLTSDKKGRVQQMNHVAEALTGWKEAEAIGKPLKKIFKIINEESRKTVENPVERVLREGVIVGLANHTLLISKDGTEIPIADSGAPIWDDAGKISGVVLVFRDQTKEREAQQAIQEAKEYAESIIATLREPLLVLDGRLKILSANRSFYQTFKVTQQDTIGKYVYDIGNQQWNIPELRDLLEKILPQNTSFNDFEITHNFKHIGIRTVLLNARRIYKEPEKTQMILLAIEDITERRQTEEKLNKSYRLYATLSQINQAIVRERDSMKLLQEICDIAVQFGKFKFAWMGLIDQDSKLVKPAAFSGEGSDYLKHIEISVESGLKSRGPTGRAIREGRSVSFNNLGKNLDFKPWRKEALERGFHSSAAFPVRIKNRVIGALNVYAVETDFFDQDEMALMEEAVLDISFALEKLEEDKKHHVVEEKLKESNRIINRSPAVIFLWENKAGWPVEYVSDNVQRLLGYSSEEFISGAVLYADLIHPDDIKGVSAQVEIYSTQKSTNSFSQEYRIIRKDGTTLWIDDRTWVRRNKKGEITHFQGIILDITERRQAEENLYIKDFAFNSSLSADSIGNTEGVLIHANPAFARIWGYTNVEEVIGKPIFDFMADKEVALEIVNSLNHSGKWSGEYLALKKNGSTFIAHSSANAVYDTDGNQVAIYSSVVDVTEQKKTEKALCISEEKMRSIFRVAPVGIGVVKNRILLEVNPRICEMSGYEKQELIGKNARMLYPTQEDFEYVGTEKYRQIRKYGTGSVETRWQKKDGSVIDILLVSTPIDSNDLSKGTTFTVLEITARKRAEKEIRDAKDQLELIIDKIPGMLAYVDVSGKYKYVNKAYAQFYNLPKEKFIEKQIKHILPDYIYKKVKDKITQVLNGKTLSFENEYNFEDGQKKIVFAEYIPQFDPNGKVLAFLAVIQDITERRQIEKALIDSEANYRALFEGISDAVFVHPLKEEGFAKFIAVNDAACTRYGYTREEFMNMSPKDISISRDTHLRSSREGRKKLLKDNWMIFEAEHINKRGKRIPVEISSRIFELQGRKVIMSMARDITDRKQAEREIRESEERFRLAFNTIPDAVSLSRISDGTYIDANEKFYQLTGFSPEEVIGKRSTDINIWKNPKDRPYLIEKIKSHKIVENMEVDFKMKNGKNITGLLSAGVLRLNQEQVLLSIAHDISDMKLAQEALKRSELKYKTVAEHTHDFEYWVGPDGRYIYISPSCKQITGYDIEEFMADPNLIFRMIKPTYSKKMKDHFRNENSEKKLDISLEFPIITKQGRERWLEHHCTAVYDEQGVFLGRRGNNRDITDRKLAEAERERLSIGIEYAAEAVVITDTNGDIQYVNPAFEQVTGYSKEEVLGENPRILRSGEHDRSFYTELWNTLISGNVWRGKFINRRKNGELYTEETTISPVYDSNQQITNFVAVKRDITKEEELEQQFRQAQKMDSVGRLAGGVAHDFNNMLSVILGYSELALASLGSDEKLYKNIKEIQKAGQRSADLTRQLLAFSRKQTIVPRALNLNDAVGSMLKMLRRLIGENINLAWMPGPNLGNIYLDPAQVDQLLANLCVNARDAINDTGQIIIETKQVDFDEAYCENHSYAKPGAYIQLTVSDDGCGMEQQVKDKIFEPFFTTKAQGAGTGLGLATVYGIVKQNNGLINVYSEPGEGSSFKLYFPLYEAPQEVKKTEEKIKLPTGSGELILLVEDELSILELTRDMIEGIGYSVIATASPEEALILAAEQKDEIVLLISDVVMPAMNGKELADHVQKIHKKMKVLFMSGYTSDVIASRGVLDEGVNFINKPFSLAQLANKLDEILNI